MQLTDFQIGGKFAMGGRVWMCTDRGTRTIAAICISEVTVTNSVGGVITSERVLTHAEAQEDGWFIGPPYSVAEHVIDEDDFPSCEILD